MPDLKDFTDATAREFGFQTTDDPRRPRTAEQLAEEWATAHPDVEDEPTDAGEDEDGGDAESEESELSEAEIAEAHEAFWASLNGTERDAAESSEAVLARLWARWSAEQGYESDDGDEDTAPSGDGPTTGLDMIRYAYATAADLTDEDGVPLTPAAWVSWALHADEASWLRACRATGWDPRVRISNEDVRFAGRGVQGETIATDWAAHVARLQEQGRRFGE